jgi:hypothetical protein
MEIFSGVVIPSRALFSRRVVKFAISGPKDLAMAGGSGRPGCPKILLCLDATTAEDHLFEALRV